MILSETKRSPTSRFFKIVPAGFVFGSVLALGWSFFLPRKRAPEGLKQSPHVLESAGDSFSVQAEDSVDLTIANPEYDPETVVRMQLDSMRQAAQDPERLIVCYSLASPANRVQTGPFPRFARLFDRPPYDALIGHRNALIGRATIAAGVASVMVTIVSAEGQTFAFGFVLSRHKPVGIPHGTTIAGQGVGDGPISVPPYLDCWMTDAVAPIEYAETSPLDDSPNESADVLGDFDGTGSFQAE